MHRRMPEALINAKQFPGCMLKIPKSKIIEAIVEKTQLPPQDIEEKIEAKLQQLSGLISEEGAAHIVANELGVPIFSTPTEGAELQIKEIMAGMRSVQVTAKVTQIYEARTFMRDEKEGHVQATLIGDESGQMRCTFWNEAVSTSQKINIGDVLEISGAYAKENNGQVELSITDPNKIIINPEGKSIESVGQMQAQEAKHSYIKDIKKGETVMIIGTLVQMYAPVFFVPRAERQEGKEYTLDEKSACVLNMIVDDGTETLRTVAFTNTVVDFFAATVDELKSVEKWEVLRNETMGTLVQCKGRVTYNERMQRTEVVLQSLEKVTGKQALEIINSYKKVK